MSVSQDPPAVSDFLSHPFSILCSICSIHHILQLHLTVCSYLLFSHRTYLSSIYKPSSPHTLSHSAPSSTETTAFQQRRWTAASAYSPSHSSPSTSPTSASNFAAPRQQLWRRGRRETISSDLRKLLPLLTCPDVPASSPRPEKEWCSAESRIRGFGQSDSVNSVS